MTINQISLFVENLQGRLADVTELLGRAGIDLRAMSLADTRDFGVLRIIVDNPQGAEQVLREAGYVFSITPVLAVSIADAPGSLGQILRTVADAGVAVEYLYAFVTRKAGNAGVVLRADDNGRAARALSEGGIKTVGPEELFAS
jgi:hypothetical protein